MTHNANKNCLFFIQLSISDKKILYCIPYMVVCILCIKLQNGGGCRPSFHQKRMNFHCMTLKASKRLHTSNKFMGLYCFFSHWLLFSIRLWHTFPPFTSPYISIKQWHCGCTAIGWFCIHFVQCVCVKVIGIQHFSLSIRKHKNEWTSWCAL